MGNSVKWPDRMNSYPKSCALIKWSKFHNDHSHQRDECVALRLKVAELLKHGHLKELLIEKGREI